MINNTSKCLKSMKFLLVCGLRRFTADTTFAHIFGRFHKSSILCWFKRGNLRQMGERNTPRVSVGSLHGFAIRVNDNRGNLERSVRSDSYFVGLFLGSGII